MKRRLLFIYNHRPGRGGLSGQVEELTGALRSEGYIIEMASTYGGFGKRLLLIIRAILKCFRADVIIGVGSAFRGMLPMIVAGIGSRLSRRPIIYNFHDGQAAIFLKDHHRWTKRLIADRPVVAATSFVTEAFNDYNMRNQVISNHFDFERNFHRRKTPYSTGNRILWARAFEELYQPELFLKAALIALKTLPDLEFHLYGDGSMLSDLQRRYKHESIIFHGRLTRDQFLKEYERFPILVNTTAYDNCPTSLVEAGYNELLVISTRIGGIASLYDDDEILFYDDGNAEQLSELICQAVTNPAACDNHRRRLSEKVITFTWENVRQDWLDLIESTTEQ